jgi:hypothetical protein
MGPRDKSIFLSVQSEAIPEVYAPYLRILCQFNGTTGGQNSSVGENIGPVGDRQGFAYVVIGNQQSDLPVLQDTDYGLDIFDRPWINTRERFIE